MNRLCPPLHHHALQQRARIPCHHKKAVGALFLIMLVLPGITCHAASSADSGLFSFTGENGVQNFSDRPNDPRYKPVPRAQDFVTTPALVSKERLLPVPLEIGKLIQAAATQTRLEPELIEAVVRVESAFDPRARSPKGALGLMQIMPATATRYGINNPLNPKENLSAGSRYLRDLLARFKNLPLALAAYNAGEAALERHDNTIPPYPETIRYIPAVLGHYERLRQTRQASHFRANSPEPTTHQSPRPIE